MKTESLRILFRPRRNHLTLRGGDLVSLEQSVRALQALGAECVISNDLSLELARFDLVHLYTFENLTAMLEDFVNARRSGKHVVVTPIYWRRQYWDDMSERNAVERPNFDPAHMDVNDPSRRALVHWLDEQADRVTMQLLLDACGKIFPFSETEGALIAEDFNIAGEKICTAPDGLDEEFAQGDANRFWEKYAAPLGGKRDFVMTAARIEAQKNTLNVIRAWNSETIPLVFIGRATEPAYFEQCRAEAGAHVHFLGEMSPADLADAYAAAKVHVLASWWELMPHSAVEAALAHCNLAVTQNCPAREIFGDDCWICDPSDGQSIHAAIRAAFDAPRQTQLASHLRERFTWERTGKILADAYRQVVSQPVLPPNHLYLERLHQIAALRAEAWKLRELHYHELEARARELRGWLRELENQRAARKSVAHPLHFARRWLKRVQA